VLPQFQAKVGEQLVAAVPPEHERPVRVFAQDESREARSRAWKYQL
jgi:hypothetical protein